MGNKMLDDIEPFIAYLFAEGPCKHSDIIWRLLSYLTYVRGQLFVSGALTFSSALDIKPALVA